MEREQSPQTLAATCFKPEDDRQCPKILATKYRVIQKGWFKSKANLFINELT
jgi:hypothetical protein